MESRRSIQWSHKFPSLIQPNFFQCHCCHRHTICFFSCRFGVTSASSGRFSPPTRTSSNITFEYFMRGYSSELELWRWQSKQGWTGIRSKRNEFLERIPFWGIGIGTQFLFEVWNDFEERIPFLGILRSSKFQIPFA